MGEPLLTPEGEEIDDLRGRLARKQRLLREIEIERDAWEKRVAELEAEINDLVLTTARGAAVTIRSAKAEARRDALIEAAEFVDSLCIGTVHSGSAQVIAKMLRGKAEEDVSS